MFFYSFAHLCQSDSLHICLLSRSSSISVLLWLIVTVRIYLPLLFSPFLPVCLSFLFSLSHTPPPPCLPFSLNFFNLILLPLSSLFSWPRRCPPAWLKQVTSLLRPHQASPRRPPPSRNLRASQVMPGMSGMMMTSCWPWLHKTLILRWLWRQQIRWATRCSDFLWN